jgi:hypothetical protein
MSNVENKTNCDSAQYVANLLSIHSNADLEATFSHLLFLTTVFFPTDTTDDILMILNEAVENKQSVVYTLRMYCEKKIDTATEHDEKRYLTTLLAVIDVVVALSTIDVSNRILPQLYYTDEETIHFHDFFINDVKKLLREVKYETKDTTSQSTIH